MAGPAAPPAATAEPRTAVSGTFRRRRRFVALVALAALAACGKKGRLELPPEPADEEDE